MSLDYHRHCQYTVLSANGTGNQNGETWEIINNLTLSRLPTNWKTYFTSNTENITQDLASILKLINEIAFRGVKCKVRYGDKETNVYTLSDTVETIVLDDLFNKRFEDIEDDIEELWKGRDIVLKVNGKPLKFNSMKEKPDEVREVNIEVGSSELGSTVSFTQTLASGTEIGTITIDGQTQSIYAPISSGSGSNVSFNQTLDSGVEIGKITIDENTTTIYAPTQNMVIGSKSTIKTIGGAVRTDGSKYYSELVNVQASTVSSEAGYISILDMFEATSDKDKSAKLKKFTSATWQEKNGDDYLSTYTIEKDCFLRVISDSHVSNVEFGHVFVQFKNFQNDWKTIYKRDIGKSVDYIEDLIPIKGGTVIRAYSYANNGQYQPELELQIITPDESFGSSSSSSGGSSSESSGESSGGSSSESSGGSSFDPSKLHTVFFNQGSATNIEFTTKSLYEGSKYGKLPTYTKDGTTGNSWFKDTDLTNQVKSTDTFSETSDITLYCSAAASSVTRTPSHKVYASIVYNGLSGTVDEQPYKFESENTGYSASNMLHMLQTKEANGAPMYIYPENIDFIATGEKYTGNAYPEKNGTYVEQQGLYNILKAQIKRVPTDGLYIFYFCGYGIQGGQGTLNSPIESGICCHYNSCYDSGTGTITFETNVVNRSIKNSELFNLFQSCKGRVFAIFDCNYGGDMYASRSLSTNKIQPSEMPESKRNISNTHTYVYGDVDEDGEVIEGIPSALLKQDNYNKQLPIYLHDKRMERNEVKILVFSGTTLNKSPINKAKSLIQPGLGGLFTQCFLKVWQSDTTKSKSYHEFYTELQKQYWIELNKLVSDNTITLSDANSMYGSFCVYTDDFYPTEYTLFS